MDEENWIIDFTNIIIMDDENIEKFKKLYGEGQRLLPPDSLFDERKLSFSQIIPEAEKNESDKEWFDNSQQDAFFIFGPGRSRSELIGKSLAKWRLDHWGTSSDLMYEDGPCLQTLEGLLKGEYGFYTLSKPPIKIYEKMAADGLVFETKWGSSAFDEWAVGKGQVVDGQFQYHIGPTTGSEEMLLIYAGDRLLDPKESPNDRSTIVVKNREHLDQLIQLIQGSLEDALYMGGPLKFIREISKNTIILNNVIDLNFLDVSNVTDLSYLFANFDVSPYPEKGWFCKIKLDISKWNVSNVTKMAHLLDNERVDLGDLSKWDRSKVTDC